MKVSVFRAGALPPELCARWAEVQERNPALSSPFFRPEFTQAVSKVRNDVFTAVIDDGAAFLPFQRSSFGLGRPVGSGVSDYHGLIAGSDYACDLAALMKACGLSRWSFDHVPADQKIFAPWTGAVSGSPVLDVLDGVPTGSTALYSDHRRKLRRLERECGPVEVDLDIQDFSALDLCLKWKSAQYRRTGIPDPLERPWARALAELISTYRNEQFAGILSVLRVGETPIAAHFGLRSGTVWHYWFPSYDTNYQRYSPGILLLLKMIEGAPRRGIKSIDFGRGDNDYKLRFANRRIPIIEGSVTTNHSLQVLSKIQRQAKLLAKKIPAAEYILQPIKNARQWSKLR
jgi:CelD/BcsL family acetyltransferase involved in cellulose biosynthesis